jgi:hypothetical protein
MIIAFDLDFDPHHGVWELPPTFDEDGYSVDGADWIDTVTRYGTFIDGYWQIIDVWGRDAWPVGNPPYLVYGYCDAPDTVSSFGIFTFAEGDITIASFPNVEARDAALNDLIADHWRWCEKGPADLPAAGHLPHHRGAPAPTAEQAQS